MEILSALRRMEQSGKGPLKGSKDGWKMDRRTLCPKLKERKGAKGREAQLSVTWVTWVKERLMIRLNYRAIIGLEGRNGFYKYVDACRYSHDGPKGSRNSSTTMAVTTKKIKKEDHLYEEK